MISPDFEKKPPLIFIVENTKTLRLGLRQVMKKEGYRVAEASDGEECLDVCPTQKPDLVLLDAVMPGMDGFSCCAQLQTLLGDDCPPVLMINVPNDEASVEQAFEVGATDYITKPIYMVGLRQRVRHLLQSRWAIAQLRQYIEREHQLAEQLEAANQELQRVASVDSLTQIANRCSFDEYLNREWKRLTRERKPLSLIICDIDAFKAYNETYGHQAGDECLKLIADTIRQVAKRPADLVARFGGEEFAVILPNTPARGAVQVAEAIRSEVKAQAIAHAGSLVSKFVTLSLGVACIVPSSKSSTDRLIAEADEALYQAKIGFGDRVVFNQGNFGNY